LMPNSLPRAKPRIIATIPLPRRYAAANALKVGQFETHDFYAGG
jgi:hypothetical protein